MSLLQHSAKKCCSVIASGHLLANSVTRRFSHFFVAQSKFAGSLTSTHPTQHSNKQYCYDLFATTNTNTRMNFGQKRNAHSKSEGKGIRGWPQPHTHLGHNNLI